MVTSWCADAEVPAHDLDLEVARLAAIVGPPLHWAAVRATQRFESGPDPKQAMLLVGTSPDIGLAAVADGRRAATYVRAFDLEPPG